MAQSPIFLGRAETVIPELNRNIDLTFLDPPFNQGKKYRKHKDNLPIKAYWGFIRDILKEVHSKTNNGGAIYFLHREKNTSDVLLTLEEAGFTFQNLIIWKKMTSAVPQKRRFGKSYQILAFATKGEKPKMFNRLRIDAPLPANYKTPRPKGVFVNDIWSDIRELTSGFLAGDEAIRVQNGKLFSKKGVRFHKQQSPLALAVRIILSSSISGDVVLDCCAGTGTLTVASNQLGRHCVSIEVDPLNVDCIKQRLKIHRSTDNILKLKKYYRFTENIEVLWGRPMKPHSQIPIAQQIPEKKKNADLFQFL